MAHPTQSVMQAALEHYESGNALQLAGKLDEAIACYRKAIALKPDFADALGNMGKALLAQDKLDEAASCYQLLVAIEPKRVTAHNYLGNILQIQGKLQEAVASYRGALSIAPDFAGALNNLGAALQTQGKPVEAEACYRRVLAQTPDATGTLVNLGLVLQIMGKLNEAEECHRRSLTLKPDNPDAHIGLARLFLDRGKFDDAQTELSGVLAMHPEHPVAWAVLSLLRKMTGDDRVWIDTALRLAAHPLPIQVTIELQFAIGKYYDDTGQHDLAFAAYKKANSIHLSTLGKFDRAQLTLLIDRLIAINNTDTCAQQFAGASPSRRPVLIVGMPRSGTSLIEQIIATHPQAHGAGELAFWGSQSRLALLPPGKLDPASIAKVASEYEQCLAQHSTDADRVVDKMPHNFRWLGLIHAAFPHAKIIHARRNPADTCLSIFFQYFISPLHSYGCDLEDLVFYYREYERLMHHWRTVLPADRFLEVPYEALIDNQAEWSRRIIEFIGLEWDERCLEFHQTERKVGTASNWQVRQKIYSTSKARWQRYEKHVGPLLELLEPSRD